MAAHVRTPGDEMADFGVIAPGIIPGALGASHTAFERLGKRDPDGLNDSTTTRLARRCLGTRE